MKGQIRLNEQQLQDFISYSVRRILREGQYNLPYYEVKLDPENNEELAQTIENQYNKQNDVNVEMLDSIWPLYIEVSYDYEAPGDPGFGGNVTLVDWEIESGHNIPEELKDFLNKVINDYVFNTAKEYIRDDIMNDIRNNSEPDNEPDDALREENRGIMVHYEAGSSGPSRNPYKGMTWDEYCAAKQKEREEEKARFAREAEREKNRTPSKAAMIHFNTDDKEEEFDRFAFRNYDPAYTSIRRTRKKEDETEKGEVNEHSDRMRNMFPSFKMDPEGELANKIYGVMGDLEDEIEKINQMTLRGEDVSYNTRDFYSAMVEAYESLNRLVHFEDD